MSRSIAFYAPLKSPHHPTPSGDRTMARGLANVLGQIGTVDLVSDLRSRDGVGDSDVQARIIAEADAEAEVLIAHHDWDVWVTYHNYYKAPDLIGPKVCAALGIPYYLIEASRAQKRLKGPWAHFAKRAEAACDAAQAIYYFTEQDRFALDRDAPDGQVLHRLHPFLDRDELPVVNKVKKDGSLLAVGMFRKGDKLASYTNLAAALVHVQAAYWTLEIVGAGEAEAEVRTLFAPFGERVSFLGELPAPDVMQKMITADVFVWPGVNEAFGMVYLEAQAAGTPVIAEYRAGVRDVIGPASTLSPQDDAKAFGAAIDDILRKPRDVNAHRQYISEAHLRGTAVATFRETLTFKDINR